MSKKIWYWFPPLVWMGIIFYFSSFPRVSITENTLYAFLFFKTLHLIEYATLFLLLFRAFYSLKGNKLDLRYKFILALFVGVLYAISDEYHQMLIPTREGTMRDVLIDATGMILMYIYIRVNLSKLKKILI